MYYVISLEDNNDKGTFRYAINQANNNILSNIIFLVSGVINLRSSLPIIKKQTNIDATKISNYLDTPLVEINCNNFMGISIKANLCQIYGLSITNAKKAGILINGNDMDFKTPIKINRHGYAHWFYSTTHGKVESLTNGMPTTVNITLSFKKYKDNYEQVFSAHNSNNSK